MIKGLLAGAVALGCVASAAMADNPGDPSMRSAAARARDKAIIKGLNQAELARVQARDAQYAAGWQAYRTVPAENARRQDDYQRRMAEWRHAVAACNAGDYSYCPG